MEHTYFEAPEYPILNQLQKGCITFVRYALALAGGLLVLRLVDFAYGMFTFKPLDSGFNILVEALIYDFVFVLKCLPVFYLIFLLTLFSLREKHHIYNANYIVLGVFLLLNIFFTQHSYHLVKPVGAGLFAARFDFSSLLTIFALASFPTSIAAFTLLYRVTEDFEFVDKYVAYLAMIIGIILLFSGMSTVPERKGFKSDAGYLVTINKTSYFLENVYEKYFEDEPEVDIYDANYLD